MERAVALELPNVATSARSLGTVSGFQFAAVFQSSLLGSSFQVALPAKSVSEIANKHRLQKSGRVLIRCFSIKALLWLTRKKASQMLQRWFVCNHAGFSKNVWDKAQRDL
jgi:hypothetical protein